MDESHTKIVTNLPSTIRSRLWQSLVFRPAHLLVGSFLFVILVGTFLLYLPTSVAEGQQPLSLVDALFTATSAVCVTGLVVVDTGSYFSLSGQMIILFLIQIGGLGIMTITTFIALTIGGDLGLRGEFAIRDMIGEKKGQRALKLVKFIILVTFVSELIGMVFLTTLFMSGGMNFPKALYHGMFHSVSAFCNAGFSLNNDSLVGYANGSMVPFIISFLIILGGLGFGVLFALGDQLLFKIRSYMNLFRSNEHKRDVTLFSRLTYHAKLVLGVTVFLIVLGTLLIAVSEYFNSNASENGFLGHLYHSYFQSVTSRTAGFNTVDLTEMAPSSIVVMIFLMVIGAAPGSTGGGIKVTTFLVIIAVIGTVIRGRKHVVLSGREVGIRTLSPAVSLLALANILILFGFFVLLITDGNSLTPLQLLFEAVSAFGTVGLSLDTTANLGMAGRICIIALMFIGRVGVISLLLLFRKKQRSIIQYPKAEIMIG